MTSNDSKEHSEIKNKTNHEKSKIKPNSKESKNRLDNKKRIIDDITEKSEEVVVDRFIPHKILKPTRKIRLDYLSNMKIISNVDKYAHSIITKRHDVIIPIESSCSEDNLQVIRMPSICPIDYKYTVEIYEIPKKKIKF
ncbi:hypothetical protein ApNV_025 [Aratus pisonii nudivirus]|nr:hypothetical protein ApNV_025 [Aratus pisonii nudivirus]